MKTWIHQIKESMLWQESNATLLRQEYAEDPTPVRLQAWVESYGRWRWLKGRYDQWHIDAKEVEAGTF